MEILKGLLVTVLFIAACALLPRWFILWVSLRRAPIVGRVLETPIEDMYMPRGRADRYRLLVEVDGSVRKLDVMSKALWIAAKPGQLLRLWTAWGAVARVEVVEPARPENVIRAQEMLKRWRSGGAL